MKEFEVSEDYNLIEEEALRQYEEYEEEACLRTEGLVLFRDSFFNLFNSNDGQSKLDMVIGILTIVSVMLMLIILIFTF